MWADLAGADVLAHASKLVHLAFLNEHEFSFMAKLSSLQMLLYLQAEFSIMREYKIAVVKKNITGNKLQCITNLETNYFVYYTILESWS